MSTKTNIIPAAVLFIVIVLSILSMTACNNLSGWQSEAELTTQIQIHETATTQRELINAALVDSAIDQILDDNR